MSTRPGYRMTFLSPITTLPNEILLRLFNFLAADGSVSIKGARTRIGHVCKQWRNLSRSHASLWSLITINAREYDPRYDNEPDYVHEDPDVTFLRQSLYLSHPLPLDISVTYTTFLVPRRVYEPLVYRVLRLLTRYSTRWRTFEWTGPARFVDELKRLTLRILKSRTLESLSLTCNDKLPESASPNDTANITLGSGIKNIELNFDMPSLQPDWSKLTSLTAGFASASLCHGVLSGATALETLFLTHLDLAREPPPSGCPTILHSVRHLKMAPCVISGFLDQFRFPQIEELSLSSPSKNYAGHAGPFVLCPNLGGEGEGWFGRIPDHVGMLCTFLQQPQNSLQIRRLNICWDNYQSLTPLLRLLETSVKALHIDFHSMRNDAQPFIQSLAISDDKPLLPNLSEICLHESGHWIIGNNFHILAHGEVLEDMILTRSALLRVLRLTAVSTSAEPEALVQSSLCLTLQSLSSRDVPADERLDVEWVLGHLDIFREGRDYARTLR